MSYRRRTAVSDHLGELPPPDGADAVEDEPHLEHGEYGEHREEDGDASGQRDGRAEEDDAEERARAVAGAKVQIGRSGRIVGQGAVQLHGGVGVTMEYSVGHYFKRVTMIDQLFGDADHHLGRVARMGGLIAA